VRFTVEGVDVQVDFPGSAFRGEQDLLLAWIKRSIGIVAGYYGRFPTSTLHIQVMPRDGDAVRGGRSFGDHGAFIQVDLGEGVNEAQLLDDWVLVHEMIHLALPDVGRDHAWLSEGLATYVEGIARAQAGNRKPADVWAEQVRSMPHGLPQAGDRGLDHTHTWGRTYWGGALFCLLADVEIRNRTHNRLGLQDAMRAVARASGGLVADWPIRRVLSVGDGAVGTPALEDLYAQMKDTAVTPDLAALWGRLGVEPESEGAAVRLRDDAPLAGVRQAIMQSRAAGS
jgi:hypothetical protein